MQPQRIQMPPAAQQIFDVLHQQICRLHYDWIIYRQLFAKDDDRVQTLNRAARGVAWLLQQLLQDAVYLSITRLTDPPQSCGKDNLTFRQLNEQLDGHADQQFLDQLANAISNAEHLRKDLKEDRNKRIAHNDLAQAQMDIFTRPSRQHIEECLAAIRDIMNLVHSRTSGQNWGYEYIGCGPGDGNALVAVLKDGLLIESLRKQMLSGKLDTRQLTEALVPGLRLPDPPAQVESPR